MNVNSSLIKSADRAVLFDWGGTLTDYIRPAQSLALMSAAGDTLHSRWRQTAVDLIELSAQRYWDSSVYDWTPTIKEIVHSALTTCGVEEVDQVSPRFVGRFLTHLGHLIRHDGNAGAVLDSLSRSGLKLGLVCNTLFPSCWHDQLLRRDGLIQFLDVRVYSSEFSARKPHESIFLAAAEQLGSFAPQNVVFVGDRALDDIAGAANVGMRTIWLRNRHVDVGTSGLKADETIASLIELIR